VTALGLAARGALEDAGDFVALTGRTLGPGLFHRRLFRDVLVQIDSLGVKSIAIAGPDVDLLQPGHDGAVHRPARALRCKEYVGNIVALSLVRELGPVLTALMVGGRIGAGITAELGSMAATEQLDAMRAMGADPVEKLVVPRVLAGALCLPLLTVLSDFLGIMASTFVASFDTRVGTTYFYSSITDIVAIYDVMGGLFKSLCFGILITLIACHRGLTVRGGTEGVGLATTRTVVTASIAVIVSDFILTRTLLAFGY